MTLRVVGARQHGEVMTLDPLGVAPVRCICVSTAPVYYHSPLYRELARDPRIAFKVIYTSDGGVRPVDHGFDRGVSWDVPLLDGHASEFISTADRNPIAGAFMSVRPGDILSRLRRAKPEILGIHGYNYLTLQLVLWTQRALGRPILLREEQTLLHPRSLATTLVKELALRVARDRRRLERPECREGVPAAVRESVGPRRWKLAEGG